MITEPTWTGETDSRRAQTKPRITRTQEKGAMAPHEADPDLPVSVQESLVVAWVHGGLRQGTGRWVWQSEHRDF